MNDDDVCPVHEAIQLLQSTMPPRTSYALTRSGVDLHAVIDAIAAWGGRHVSSPLRQVGAAG